METLYVLHEKCSVKREGEHLKFVRSGETLATIPLVSVKTIVIFDSVSITAPALDLLLYKGIDVIYQSKWGKIKGRILSAKGGGVITRLAQYSAFMKPERRLEIAKSIVAAKIYNQLGVVKKYKYHDTSNDFDKHLSAIVTLTEQLNPANSIDEVMGIEGLAAKYYWNSFKHLLKDTVFTRREYRPSPDYVNSLLNLGYAFLCSEINACLIAKHFDPEIGFLHSIHYGRNSLSLDIMEEFRAQFVDAWILTLLNKSQLKAEHFKIENRDWRLTDNGFRKFCGLYHEHVPSWRDKFRKQANNLKNALINEVAYEPYNK
jgi:CRISPR-associated protein Cas1